MSTSNATKIDVLALLFNSVPLPGTWTSNLFLALHTASPGDAGNQSTSEVAYTGYARVSTTRNGTSGWQAPNGTGQLNNVSALQFGIRSDAGSAVVATHASLGLASGQIVAYGSLATPATIVQNSVPSFPSGAIIVQVV